RTIMLHDAARYAAAIRVLHITTAFPRHEGDPIAPWLVELLVRLREAGVEAEVLTSSYRGLASGPFRGIPVHRFRYAPARLEDLTHDEAAADRVGRALRYRLLAVAYLAGGCLAALRLARSRRYDVIHVHWPVPNALLGLAARLG